MSTQPLRAGGEIEAILNRYQTMVYGLALAKTGSPSDADDVFQEVFLAYCQCRKEFRSEEHRKAWLLRTTVNLCRRVTASSWRRKTVPLDEGEEIPVPFQEPEESRVWQALSGLAEDYRLPLYCSTSRSCPPRRSPKCCPSSPALCGCACPGDGSSSGKC